MVSPRVELLVLVWASLLGWFFLALKHFESFLLCYVGLTVITVTFRCSGGWRKRRPIIEAVLAASFATVVSCALAGESWLLSDSSAPRELSARVFDDFRTIWVSIFFGWYAGLALRTLWDSLTQLAALEANGKEGAMLEWLKIGQSLVVALIPLVVAFINASGGKN